MEGLAGAASVLAVVQITAETAKLCNGYLHDVRHARQDIEQLKTQCSALHSVLERLQGRSQVTIDQDIVEHCFRDLTLVRQELQPDRKRTKMRKFGLRALKWPYSKDELQKRVKIVERYISIFNASLQLDIIDNSDQPLLSAELAYIGDAQFNSAENERRHRPCLDDTRVDILKEVEQ